MEVQVLSVLIGIVGMVLHFLKKKVREQTFDGFKQYVIGHPVYTIAATVAVFVSAWAAAPGSLADLPSAAPILIGIGYTADSLINKAVTDSSDKPT